MKNEKNAKSAAKKKGKDSNEFISEGALSSGSSAYLKLEGETTIRIISKPVEGWIDWVDKKPVRTPLADGEPEASDDDNKPKKFIAMAVLDRDNDDAVKILELTQQSVIKAIRALAANPQWGNPFSYDLNIEKKGEGLKTKYTVTPSPKKALPKDVIKAANAKPCNLENLFEGADPWDADDDQTEYHFS